LIRKCEVDTFLTLKSDLKTSKSARISSKKFHKLLIHVKHFQILQKTTNFNKKLHLPPNLTRKAFKNYLCTSHTFSNSHKTSKFNLKNTQNYLCISHTLLNSHKTSKFNPKILLNFNPKKHSKLFLIQSRRKKSECNWATGVGKSTRMWSVPKNGSLLLALFLPGKDKQCVWELAPRSLLLSGAHIGNKWTQRSKEMKEKIFWKGNVFCAGKILFFSLFWDHWCFFLFRFWLNFGCPPDPFFD
jgi:hypothetical protein